MTTTPDQADTTPAISSWRWCLRLGRDLLEFMSDEIDGVSHRAVLANGSLFVPTGTERTRLACIQKMRETLRLDQVLHDSWWTSPGAADSSQTTQPTAEPMRMMIVNPYSENGNELRDKWWEFKSTDRGIDDETVVLILDPPPIHGVKLQSIIPTSFAVYGVCSETENVLILRPEGRGIDWSPRSSQWEVVFMGTTVILSGSFTFLDGSSRPIAMLACIIVSRTFSSFDSFRRLAARLDITSHAASEGQKAWSATGWRYSEMVDHAICGVYSLAFLAGALLVDDSSDYRVKAIAGLPAFLFGIYDAAGWTATLQHDDLEKGCRATITCILIISLFPLAIMIENAVPLILLASVVSFLWCDISRQFILQNNNCSMKLAILYGTFSLLFTGAGCIAIPWIAIDHLKFSPPVVVLERVTFGGTLVTVPFLWAVSILRRLNVPGTTWFPWRDATTALPAHGWRHVRRSKCPTRYALLDNNGRHPSTLTTLIENGIRNPIMASSTAAVGERGHAWYSDERLSNFMH